MDDLAFVKPSDRLQANVRVRGHIHGFPVLERQWAEPIEEAPWPDKTAILERKGSRDRQRSKAQRPVRIWFESPLSGTQRGTFLARDTFCSHWRSPANLVRWQSPGTIRVSYGHSNLHRASFLQPFVRAAGTGIIRTESSPDVGRCGLWSRVAPRRGPTLRD